MCFGVFRRVWHGMVENALRMRCGRATSCEHVRRRRQSDECGSASICKHGRQRYLCKDCGGKGIRRRRHERRRSVHEVRKVPLKVKGESERSGGDGRVAEEKNELR